MDLVAKDHYHYLPPSNASGHTLHTSLYHLLIMYFSL